MARQLIQRGDEVGLLVLLETLVPVFDMNTISRSLRPVDRRRLPGLYPDYRLFAQRTGRAIADEFAERLAKVPEEIKQLLLKINKSHRQALTAYTPTPLAAPVAELRSREDPWRFRLGWDLFARGEYRCIEVAGDRNTMFEQPNVSALSKVLSELLKEASAG
jgi:thioesterase domain-containing protein